MLTSLLVAALVVSLTPAVGSETPAATVRDQSASEADAVGDPAPAPVPFVPPPSGATVDRTQPPRGQVLAWTPSSRTWREGPGRLVREVYSGPVFFERGDGSWAEIDPSLVAAGGGFVAAAAPKWAARVKSEPDAAGLLVSLGERDDRVTAAYPDLQRGVPGRLVESGQRVRWDGAMPGGADLEVSLTTTGFKDQVVVPDVAAGGSYVVRFGIPVGFEARQAGADVEIVDAAGRWFASYGSGVASDASGVEAPVTVSLGEQDQGSIEVHVGVDQAWLTDPARVFPVTVDPTFGVSLGWDRDTSEECLGGKTRHCDTYVNSAAPTSVPWNASEMLVGSSGAIETAGGAACTTASTANCNRNRALLKFQQDATAGEPGYRWPVTAAQVMLHAHQRASASASWYAVYPTTTEPTRSTSWNTQPAVGAVAAAQTESCLACWYVFDVTSWVSTWFNGPATQNGLRVEVPPDNGWDRQPNFGVRFSTSNGGAAHAPLLRIVYTNTAPATPVLVSPAAGATVSGGATLTASYSDAEANHGHVGFELERYDPATSLYEWVGEQQLGPVASGGQVSWSDGPSAGWTAGSYRWRARATDVASESSAWSAWRGFTVTTAATGPLDTSPVAQSDEMGMEKFYPYRGVALGSVEGFVQLRTGNLVVRHQPVDIPGPGLNTQVRLTYNAQRGVAGATGLDHGAGRGWTLSVSDGEAGLEGAAGTVDGLDPNAPVTISDVFEPDTSGVQQLVGALLEFTDGDGTTHRFRRHGGVGGRWSSPPGVSLRVFEDTGLDGTVEAYRLVRTDGVTFRLAAVDAPLVGAGVVFRVVEISDRSGNVLTYGYEKYTGELDAVWRVREIRHNRDDVAGTPGPARVRFDYTASGVLTDIQAWPGQSHQRTTQLIQSSGQLTAVIENAHLADTTVGQQAGRRRIAFTYANGVMATATDGRGAVTGLSIVAGADQRMRLTSVTDRTGKTWGFEYQTRSSDEAPQTTVASTPSGKRTTYVISGRQSVAVADKSFGNGDASDQRITGGNITAITAPDSNVTGGTSHYLWRQNRLVRSSDPTGASTSTTYNHAGLVTAVTRPPANQTEGSTVAPTTQLRYDTAAGYTYSGCDEDTVFDTPEISRSGACSAVFDLVRTATAANISAELRVSDFHPDAAGRTLRVIQRAAPSLAQAPSAAASADDRQTTMAYYNRGMLRSVDGPRIDVQDLTWYGQAAEGSGVPLVGAVVTDVDYGGYDSSGMPPTIKDAAGHTATFTFSPYGVLLSSTDRDGATTTNNYDELDRLTQQDAPVAAGTATTRHGYDGNNNRTSATSPRQVTTTFVYDANDRLTETLLLGTSAGPKVTKVYDADGNETLESGPRSGSKRTFEHYDDGSVKYARTLIDAPGGVERWAETIFNYDDAGRVTFVTQPVANAIGHRPVTEYRYTPRGQVSRTIEVSSSGAQDRHTDTVYNAHGQPVTLKGPRTASSHRAQTIQVYDRFGDQVRSSRLRSDGVYIHTDHTYDKTSNLIAVEQPFRTATSSGDATAEKLLSTYRYDARNLLAEQTADPFNPGHTVSYTYSGEQRQQTRVDHEAGVAVRTATAHHNPDGSLERLETQQHGTSSKTVSACYTRPDGIAGYDLDGNLTYVRTVEGTCAAGTIVADQSFTHNTRGWMDSSVQRVRAPNATYVTREQAYSYDPDGAAVGRTHHTRSVSYTNNLAGWPTTTNDWRNITSADTYLPSGAATTRHLGGTSTTAADVSAAMTYLPDGSLASLSWQRPAGTIIRRHASVGYDVGGLLTTEQVTIRRPDGTSHTGTATYGYDLLDRLTAFTSPYPYSTKVTAQPATAYVLDDAGNIETEAVTTAGTTRMTADPTYTTGKLTTKTATSTPGDGNVTSSTATQGFTHDILGQEKQRTTTTDTTYVASPSTTVNAATATDHHPTGHTQKSATTYTGSAPLPPDSEITYIHDAHDRIVSRTQGTGTNAGTTLYFYWATSPALAEETDTAGGTKVRYLPGSAGDLIAQQSYDLDTSGNALTTGERWSWLLTDTHGNTATLLAPNGDVLEQKAFDPYGKTEPGGTSRTTTTGAPTTTLGYQSAPTDPTTGNVWLGPRLYDPTTAQFTTADHYTGSWADLSLAVDPLTGNRYLYAGGNPVAYADDGHAPCDRQRCPDGYDMRHRKAYEFRVQAERSVAAARRAASFDSQTSQNAYAFARYMVYGTPLPSHSVSRGSLAFTVMGAMARLGGGAVKASSVGKVLDAASRFSGHSVGLCASGSIFGSYDVSGGACYMATPDGRSGFTVTSGVGAGAPWGVAGLVGLNVGNAQNSSDLSGTGGYAWGSGGLGPKGAGASGSHSRNAGGDDIWQTTVGWAPGFRLPAPYSFGGGKSMTWTPGW